MQIRQVQSSEDISKAYPCTTETPIPFWADGLPLCREWLKENLGKHIEGFHLEDDEGKVIGHIYWSPSTQALTPYDIEEGVAFVYCDWVQKQYRGLGGAHLLYQGFIDYLRKNAYKGMLVNGTDYEGYMYYQHFLKRGFKVIGERNGEKQMYFLLRQETIVVKPFTPNLPGIRGDGVEVLIICSRSCPVGASAVLALHKVAQEHGAKVAIREVPGSKKAIEEYGVAGGIFINGKVKFFGPVTESQVRKAIEEEL